MSAIALLRAAALLQAAAVAAGMAATANADPAETSYPQSSRYGYNLDAGRHAAGRTREIPAAGPRFEAVPLDDEKRVYIGEPISLYLTNADLRDVLATFAELTKLNMAIDPDVRGSVTVRLTGVPWDQALELILRQNGLGFELSGTVMRVAKPSRLAVPRAVDQ